MQLSWTGGLNDFAFHLQRHILDHVPNFVLILWSACRKDEFPFAETKLLDLLRSLVLDQIARLLGRSRRNVFTDLVSPIWGWASGGLCGGQGVSDPTIFRSVIVLENFLTVVLNLLF